MPAIWCLPWPVSVYGNCDSRLVVTGMRRGQGTSCSPPTPPPRVTLLSACQYACTWHTVLSYYPYCSIALSTEYRGASHAGLRQRHMTRFGFFYFQCRRYPTGCSINTLRARVHVFGGNGCRCHTLFCCGLPPIPRPACGVPAGPCCCCCCCPAAIVTFLCAGWPSGVADLVPCGCGGSPAATVPFPPCVRMTENTI